MKTLIAAASVLALSTGAAFAQSSLQSERSMGMMTEGEGAATYSEVYSPSEGTAYEFHGDGMSPAPGFYPQNATEAQDWTPNMGAGTTRSSNANSG